MVLIGFFMYFSPLMCTTPAIPPLNPYPLYTHLNHTSNNERGEGRRQRSYSVHPSAIFTAEKKKVFGAMATRTDDFKSNAPVCTVVFMDKRLWTEGGTAKSAAFPVFLLK